MRLRGLFAVLFLVTGLRAQTLEETHNALRAMKKGVVEAANHRDYAGLLDYLHPDVVITWQDAKVCRGRAGVEAYLRWLTEGDHRLIESFKVNPTVDELTILYGDTGVAFGSSEDEFHLTRRFRFKQHSRWTATLVKFEGRWVVASLQASVDVFDNPMLSAAKRTGQLLGVGGLILGLLGGWWVARRTR